MLRAVKPEEVETYLKLLAFGEAGSGKTWTFCQFPKPYFCDLEQGAEKKAYRDLLKTSGGVIFSTIDMDEIIREVTSLLSEKHDFKTLVIDPITAVFKDEADFAELRVGSEYGKHTAEADKKWRKLGKLIKRLKMNVLVSAYQKKDFETEKLVPSGPKDLNHFFDVVIRTEKRGDERVGIVVKSRLEEFPDNGTIAWNYQSVAERIGSDLLNRAPEQVILASEEQIRELNALLSQRVDADQLRTKWLKKANADELSELPADAAVKCIDLLKNINAKATAA